jgi:pimeloyl-ACP methyl ester carboxylesterase
MKPKLLLLHGALGSSEIFIPLVEELKNDFECIVFDFPGHGNAKFEEIDFSVEFFSSKLNNFILSNGYDELIVFGYSMGGYIALNTELNFPNSFKKIITLGTKFNWSPDIAKKELLMLDPEKIESKVPSFSKILNERHVAFGWKNLCLQTQILISKIGESPLADLDLNAIDCSVQLMVGDHDTMVSIEETTNTYRQLKNGSMVVIPNCVHPIEKINLPDLVFELKRFIAS